MGDDVHGFDCGLYFSRSYPFDSGAPLNKFPPRSNQSNVSNRHLFFFRMPGTSKSKATAFMSAGNMGCDRICGKGIHT
jgi:hypothetical protein